MTISLEIMIDTATVATMTMPVAAEKPPMKVASVSSGLSSAIGNASTKVSGSTLPSGNSVSPAAASGSTKMPKATRYAGSSQRARAASSL